MTSNLSLFDLQCVKCHLSLVTILSVPSVPLIFQLLISLPLNNSEASLLSLIFSLCLHSFELSRGLLFLNSFSLSLFKSQSLRLLFFGLLSLPLLLSVILSLLSQALLLCRFSLES
jgi:hypothetical protein